MDVADHHGQGQADVIAGKLAPLVTSRLTQQSDGAGDGELLQALVGEAQLMAAELIVITGAALVETVRHLTPGKTGLRGRHEEGALMAPLLIPLPSAGG